MVTGKRRLNANAPVKSIPTSQEQMRPVDIAMVRAIANRDEGKLEDAIREGADIKAYHFDDKLPVFSGSGKLPIHLAATTGFKKGVEMLVHLGADVDAPDANPRTQNAPLHVSMSHRDQFMALLGLGADLDVPNHLGYSPRQVAIHGENKLSPQPRPPFTTIIRMFEAVPNRDDFTGLTVDDLFKRNEKGLCLMDNPQVLRRIDEVATEVAKNGAPLTLEHLRGQIPAEATYLTPERLPLTLKKLAIGVKVDSIGQVMKGEAETTYLDRVADVGSLGKCISFLNKQGSVFQGHELLADEKPTALLQMAQDKHQLQALFTSDNWKGASPASLTATYRMIPESSRWQVKNYMTLSQELRANAQERGGMGR